MISLFLARMVFMISLLIRKYLSVFGRDMGIEKMVMIILEKHLQNFDWNL
jgi:hypothetical protein